MVGWLLSGAFVGVVASFLGSEFLLERFSSRQPRRIDERRSLSAILLANFVSLEMLWIGGGVLATLSGLDYVATLAAAFVIQAIWLVRHLWLFHRNHLRMADVGAGARMRRPLRPGV